MGTERKLGTSHAFLFGSREKTHDKRRQHGRLSVEDNLESQNKQLDREPQKNQNKSK